MHEQSPADPTATFTPLGTQVSTDRPCASCGFNLFGQILQREPIYKLIVARCPECGTVASLQEYPAMTSWVGRWKLALVSLWILLLIGAFVGNFAAAGGLNAATVELASENYADTLIDRYVQSNESKSNGLHRYAPIDPLWAQQNAGAILDEIGGVLSGANKAFLAVWLGGSIAMFSLGVFWSVTLLGARRRAAMLLPAIAIIAGASVVLFNTNADGLINMNVNYTYSQRIAEHAYGKVFVPLTALVLLLASALGVFMGRKLARLLVVLMLPPRLRTPLAILWTRDGLDPPKPRMI
jgi:hypothetical protein